VTSRLPFPSRPALVASAAALVVLGAPAGVLIAADDDPKMRGVAEPTRVDDSGRSAARAVEAVMGERMSDDDTVAGATCRAGACTVRYRTSPRGEGVMRRDTNMILSRIFADDGVDSVKLYVHHQSVGTPKKDERAAFGTVSCDRAAFEGGDCAVTHASGGKQRSLMHRGKLSVDAASRGGGK
jgi:hypothetical protein